MSTQAPPSTRKGTTDLMFLLAGLSALGGLACGVAFAVRTGGGVECGGLGQCSPGHPYLLIAVIVIVTGLVQAAVLSALGLIARSVGEMHAAQLGITAPDLQPRQPGGETQGL